MDDVFISLLRDFGFPVAVCIYLLVERRATSKSLDKNTEVLGELKTVIAIHTATNSKIEDTRIKNEGQ